MPTVNAKCVYDPSGRPYLLLSHTTPGFKPLTYKGRKVFGAPLTHDNMRTAKQTHKVKIGFMSGYKWPAPPHIKPMRHQIITSNFMVRHRRAWILNKMRSGKTLSTIWAMDRLFEMGEIKKVLILSPLSIMKSVWRTELFMVMPQREVYIADESVEDLVARMTHSRAAIMVVNHDKIRSCYKNLDRWMPDLIVADEAGGFRSTDSARVKALRFLLKDTGGTTHKASRRFLPLTATPCPQSPMDIWSIANIVNPEILPKTMTAFRERTMNVIRRNGSIASVKPKPGAEKYVQKCMVPAIKFRTEDCIDMPPQGYVTRLVSYTPSQRKALKEMKKTHATLITDINTGAITEVVAQNAAIALSKYLQICGGVTLDNKGRPQYNGARSRVAEIISILDEIGPTEKMVLMCSYTNIQHYVQDQLTNKGIVSVIVNGAVTGNQRDSEIDRFKTQPEVRVLILHPNIGKWGHNLSVANTTVWYLPVFSADEYIQGNARMQSPVSNTKKKTTVVRLCGGPNEEKLYDRISDRETFQDTVTDVFRQLLGD